MKRLFTLLALALLAVGLFSGCAQADEAEPLPPADPALHCTVYEELVPEFTFTHIYGNPGVQQTWLWVDGDMTDAALISINYGEETFAPIAGEIVYSFGDVAAGEGILLYMEMPEGFPTHALSYSCGGTDYAYALGYSGIDGSTTLTDIKEL